MMWLRHGGKQGFFVAFLAHASENSLAGVSVGFVALFLGIAHLLPLSRNSDSEFPFCPSKRIYTCVFGHYACQTCSCGLLFTLWRYLMPVKCHFLGWDEPVTAKVRTFLMPQRVSGPVDLGKDLIVVPTHQAGRRLMETLALLRPAAVAGDLGVHRDQRVYFIRLYRRP